MHDGLDSSRKPPNPPRSLFKGRIRVARLAPKCLAEVAAWPSAHMARLEVALQIFVSRRTIKAAPAHENSVVSLRGEMKTSINGVMLFYYQSQGGTFVILTAYLENPGPDDGDDGEGGPSLALPVTCPPMDCVGDACLEASAQARELAAWNAYVSLSARVWLRILSGMLFRNTLETVELARCGVLDGTHRIARNARFLGDFEIEIVDRNLSSHDYDVFQTLTDPRPLSAAETWIDADFECRRDVLLSRRSRLVSACHPSLRAGALSHELCTQPTLEMPDRDPAVGDIVMFFDIHMFRLLTGTWMVGLELGRHQDRGDLLAYQQYATQPADGPGVAPAHGAPAARLRALLRRRKHVQQEL